MRNPVLACACLLVICCIPACTPVNFYSDAGLKKKSGLKYYTAKPYLKVERDYTSNNVIKAGVLYLPDLANPQYLVMRDGPGSGKLEVKLADGMISTLGLATDPKIAESVEAMAALIAKSAAAAEDISGLKGVPARKEPVVTEFYEITMSEGMTSLKRIEIR